MHDKFVLSPAIDIFHSVLNRNTFERYDLSQFQSYFKELISKFEVEWKRKPFVYELLDQLSINSKLRRILYSKSKAWFKKVGQFFFFNLYEWNKKFIDYKEKVEFFYRWFKIFENYEMNKGMSKDIQKPNKILLELTNNCNLNCIMCGVGGKGYDSRRNMSLDLLNKLSNEILNGVYMIRVNGLGESTILPNFKEYFRIICFSNAQLEIVTNLTSNKIETWDLLLRKNTNFLISCDAGTPKMFEHIRKGANFNIFKTNLKYIGSEVSDPVKAQIIFTLMELNINEILGVIDLAADCNLGGVIINVVKEDPNNNSWDKIDKDELVKLFEIAYNKAKTRGISLKLPDHIGKYQISNSISSRSCKNHCKHPWQEVYIRYNGDLTVCNMLNPYIYGNCNLSTFNELWTGLNAFLFRNLVNTEFRHPYCEDCYYLL